MSQATASAPASSSARVVGVANQPACAVAALREQLQQPQRDLPVASGDDYVHGAES